MYVVQNLEDKERPLVKTKEHLREKQELLSIRLQQLSADLGVPLDAALREAMTGGVVGSSANNVAPPSPSSSTTSAASSPSMSLSPVTVSTSFNQFGHGSGNQPQQLLMMVNGVQGSRSTSATSSAYSSRGSSSSPSLAGSRPETPSVVTSTTTAALYHM